MRVPPGKAAMRFLLLCGVLLWPGPSGSADGSRSATVPAEPAIQEDAFGVPYQSGSPPRRIVSLSPNLTEMLFAVGVDRERIAGVTRFCDYPNEVEGLTRIGGIVDPSVETILALTPDLILATRGNPVEILGQLRAAGLRVFAFESQDGIDRVHRTMRTLVAIVSPDDSARAEATVAAFADELERLSRLASTIDDDERPSVYYYDPVSPDWTAGSGTHVDEAIALSGGINAARDAPTAWPRYALETLVMHQPEWLLVAVPQDQDAGEILSALRSRPGWRGLHAVQEGRICDVPADWLMRPGPRILRAVRRLGACLHPERDWK
jgi:iron complex transport system substrate-binding protein